MGKEKGKMDWLVIGGAGLAIWYFFFRKPGQGEGEVTPAVAVTGIQAVASPGEIGGTVAPGTSIKLRVSIQNQSTKNGAYCTLPVTVEFKVYEGSWFPTHGTLLKTLTKAVTLPANATTNVDSPNFNTVVGTIDRRDVSSGVIYQDAEIASHEWDDVYYVRQPQLSPQVSLVGISWI